MLGMVIALGLAVFFTVEIVRKLPVIRTWHLDGRKPFACDQCMSFWTSALWTTFVKFAVPLDLHQALICFPAAGGVSLFLLLWTNTFMPPDLPTLPE